MDLFSFKNLNYLLVLSLLSFSFLCDVSGDYVRSRATYYGSPDCQGTPRGACGYGEYGRIVNGGKVAGVSRLWYNGTGCGACYQVRCTIPFHCNEEGVTVVVTDYGEGDRTDFIMSPVAYAKMASAGTEKQLFLFGVVDVEFTRVPCYYAGHNLLFKIHDRSYFPHYLAIVILYAGGANDILAVELWDEESKQWRRMRHVFGAVHDVQNPPKGPLALRFLVYGSAGVTWVQTNSVIAADWSAGATYDSLIQLN